MSQIKEEDGEFKYIKWFSELGSKDVLEVGGKGANLGEMYRAKLPVPQGFVITAKAYTKFLRDTGIDKQIYPVLNKLDEEKTLELNEVAEKIENLIESKEMPQDMEKEILEAYEHLSVDENALKGASQDALSILKRAREPIFVAVRSSATSEDSPEASFAGQQKTLLNVKGKKEIIQAVKECWASLFGARSIYYRVKNKFEHEKTEIAVVVQEMINSEKSGVIFSKDPVEDTDNIVIEAVFGLGEGIVSGMIAPDNYVIDRELKILSRKISDKKIALVRNSSGATEKVKLTKERNDSQVLTDYEIKKMAQYALEVENHYNKPQDMEFAIDSGKFYIVQTRPITTMDKRVSGEKKGGELSGEVVLSGLAASPGQVSGVVKIIHDLNELNKVKKGDILVTEMTNPDMVVAMQRAAAVVTDEGGLTAHAAIVSREMGIPAIVGTRTATTTLKDGEEITVDGFHGKVYRGLAEKKEVLIEPIIEGTKTKIKVILDLPHYADRAAKTKAKAVGLTRVEGIIAESGKHPQYYVQSSKIKDYEEVIYQGIKRIAEHFEEVWVRTSDLRSDEYRNLEGAPKELEANPMLGDHGIRFSLKHPDILNAELRALQRVAQESKGQKKIGLLTPQVISVSEIHQLKEALKKMNFLEAKVGVMVETPAAVQIINELCEEGIDFISFGTNDLTQYTLAIDRGNEEVQDIYDEMHPAVLKQIAHVIRICNEYGVETSICGQAGSKKEMVEFIVRAGITSISVNADKAKEISEYVRKLEEEVNIQKETKIDDNAPAEEKQDFIEESKEVEQPVPEPSHEVEAVEEVSEDITVEADNKEEEPEIKEENIEVKEEEMGIEKESVEEGNKEVLVTAEDIIREETENENERVDDGDSDDIIPTIKGAEEGETEGEITTEEDEELDIF